jgi:hypothetical protein
MGFAGGFGGFVGGPVGGPVGRPPVGRPGVPAMKDANPSDVANTSIAALAFLRAGYTPRQGGYSALLRKAVAYVCKEVEKSDKESLSLGDPKAAQPAVPVGPGLRPGAPGAPAVGPGVGLVPGGGFKGMMGKTQVQMKIGESVDTFLAALLLSEARGKMPDAKSEKRVSTALQKLMDKIQRNQKEDGTWAGGAWAPVLGQALASRALNRARQVGVAIDPEKLERTAKHARDNFDRAAKGGREALMGAAGVSLYATASGIAGLHDSLNTVRQLADASRGILTSPSATEGEKDKAKATIALADQSEKSFLDATRSMARKASDPMFVRGFGSDGGEEFLSFALVGEALRAKNLKEAATWDKAIGDRLARTQNRDFSWSGHHCITGKTFCTAAALLSLMTDRAPIPVAEKKK